MRISDEEESHLLNATFLSPEEEGYMTPEHMAAYTYQQQQAQQQKQQSAALLGLGSAAGTAGVVGDVVNQISDTPAAVDVPGSSGMIDAVFP